MEARAMREYGFEFEEAFVVDAKARGLTACRIRGVAAFDAVVNGYRVQCKRKEFADRDGGGVRIAKGQHRYLRGEWDVLALLFRDMLYLIPEAILIRGETLATKIVPWRYDAYRDAWGIFDGEAPAGAEPVEHQATLFG
jgi:hypothetical protein